MNISAFKSAVNGKKTYILSFVGAIGILLGWSDGSINDQSAIEQIVGLVLACTIRHGISSAAEQSVEKTVASAVNKAVSQKFEEIFSNKIDKPAPPQSEDDIKITLK